MTQEPPPFRHYESIDRAPGLAVASLVMGIFSMIGGFLLLIPPILAVVFGHISRNECNRRRIKSGNGMALAGLIMGYLALIPIPLGLMAAMAIPAFQKVRATSQEKAITNNLRQIAAAGQQYILDSGDPIAEMSDLVGEGKYIPHITPVNGEDYSMLVVTFESHELSVTDRDGQEISYQF
jgi:hypothetical protein